MAQEEAVTLLPRSCGGSPMAPALDQAFASASTTPTEALASTSSPARHRPANHPLPEGGALQRTSAVSSSPTENAPQQAVEAPKNSSAPKNVSAANTAAPTTFLQGDAIGNDAGYTARPRLDDAAPFAVAAPTAAAPSSASPPTTSRAPPSSASPATATIHPERLLVTLGSGHQPSDAELLKKVLGPWVSTGKSNFRDVHQLDICSADPDELSRTYRAAVSERERVWYFLSGLRCKGKAVAGCKYRERTVGGAGTWKSEGAEKDVTDSVDGTLLGYSQKFSFLRKLDDGSKVRTGWVFNQLRLHRAGTQVQDLALCKIYRSNRRDGGAAPDKTCETIGPKPAEDQAVPGRKRVGAPLPEQAHKRQAAFASFLSTMWFRSS